MMCSRDRYELLLLMLLTVGTLAGAPRLRNLTIDVVLADNGDAYITETRQMTVEDTGTECYIVIGNLNGSHIEDVQVTDETGVSYTSHNPWDTDRSRSAKANQWGLIRKGEGYELCWGLGRSGERTYTVNYTVTGLVRAYDDYDGFNYMFVAEHLNPEAEHARVTISKQGGLTEDEVAMWAFRFKGDVHLVDGCVLAETSDELDYDHAMIIMLQLEKGVLHPSIQQPGSFEAVKERAFEDSDYLTTLVDWMKEFSAWFLLLFLWLLMPFVWLWRQFRRWRARRKVFQDLGWWRDLPANGNLQYANQVLNAYSFSKNDYKGLLSASVLRLISIGAVDIRPDGIGILDLHRERGLANTRMLRDLYEIFRDAAGDDGVLQPQELKKWMKKNEERMQRFVVELRDDRKLGSFKGEEEKVRQVFGLRQFLKDFTLANERHASEVGLWKDYLVYAELFGIARQVRKDMERLNPDFFQMDEQALQMTDRRQLPALMNTTLTGVNLNVDKLVREARRAHGGGGSASFGGGGGYSGGGSGGGIR